MSDFANHKLAERISELEEENGLLRDEVERLTDRLLKIAKHPDATELIKQYAEGKL